jgi:putative phosphoribosyl transferase
VDDAPRVDDLVERDRPTLVHRAQTGKHVRVDVSGDGPADAVLAPSAEETVSIDADAARLEGTLAIPRAARGVVLFAHGSGSSRHSSRNRYVAGELQRAGLATLLLDLVSPQEERADALTGHLRFDIGLLAARLVRATHWLADRLPDAPLGYFGASTGAAAALVAAAHRRDRVRAIVSRGGRPDLAGNALRLVRAPTLLSSGAPTRRSSSSTAAR